MNNLFKYFTFATFVLGIIVVLLSRSCKPAPDLLPLEDVIQLEKHSDGSETAKVQALELENKELKGQNQRLAELVKQSKTTTAAVISKTETDGRVSTGNVIVKIDTVYKNTSYSAFVFDRWINAYITADKDSVGLNYKIYNEFEISFDKTEKGTLVKLHNLNPNTTTTDLQAWVPKEKPKRFGIGIQAGFGATKQGISPYIGAGISYDFIRF